MSAPNEKVAVMDDVHSDKYTSSEKALDENHNIDSSNASEHTPLSEQEAGDAALANAPWQYKLLALITALLFPLGAHFSQSALSAMKAQIKSNLVINNTQYGVLSSSVSIINTIFPIAGGIFVDMFGSIWGTLGINLVVIIGSLLTAIAAKYHSFGLMVAGRVIFGIGSGLIVTMQESILSKWFRTQNLSIAIGLQLSISRLATFLGTLVANPIAVSTGDWVWAFWLSFIICCFSIIMNLIYAVIVRHLRRKAIAENHSKNAAAGIGGLMTKEEVKNLKRRKAFHWRSVFKFPIYFWHILLIEFIFAAVWSSFQTISTEFIELHFGSTKVLAGYTASASQSVPIVATPILGIIMDLFGLRISILVISAIFLILSSCLLAWTYVNATVGMVFYSISLAFGPIGMITSIGMILPSDYIGTGLGMYKASNNIGTTILDIIVGVVQDKSANQSYNGVMILFLVLSCIGLLLICALRSKRLLRMKEKNDHEVNLNKQGLDSYSDTPVKRQNYLFLGIFIVCLLVAWVLFFVYSATGRISA
ncbi:major facilitator superfamily domain-containing protein [Gilbertella persicaria]|uniref:major facilitator superfamily domain-containing protein n=1 Tax=Gilbertella persicaria TaxID=101096 RepID=UPI00222097AE|nr:major facilitator superfamily domain-containing protein [Gilbertella persicaria]KAI8062319.1 major facilitator superfamily domain-containing protein [Gilbertella persicaria]